MNEAFTAISAVLATGANGVMCVLGYVVLKHELRITRLEGRG